MISSNSSQNVHDYKQSIRIKENNKSLIDKPSKRVLQQMFTYHKKESKKENKETFGYKYIVA